MDYIAISNDLYTHCEKTNISDKDALFITLLGRCFNDYNEDGIRTWFQRITKRAKSAVIAIVTQYTSHREAERLLGCRLS